MGTPAKPIRLMVGLLILKQIDNLSDETIMAEWVSNPYFQYFWGEEVFQWKISGDPSEVVHFRHRIGVEGVGKIPEVSILMHGKEVLNEDVSIDTRAQPKNMTYPTDTELAVKIIKQCRRIAKPEEVELRRSYKFVETDLLKKANSKSQKQARAKKQARKKLKTIANRLVGELKREFTEESLVKEQAKLEIYERVLRQKKQDKDKIY